MISTLAPKLKPRSVAPHILICRTHFWWKKTDVSFNYFLSFLNQGWPQVLMKLKKIVETKIWLDIFFHPEDVFIIFCYFPKVKKVCSGSCLKWFKSSLSHSLSDTHTLFLSLSYPFNILPSVLNSSKKIFFFSEEKSRATQKTLGVEAPCWGTIHQQ